MSSIIKQVRLLLTVYSAPEARLGKIWARMMRGALGIVQLVMRRRSPYSKVHLVITRASHWDRQQIARRISFYTRNVEHLQVNEVPSISQRLMWSREPILVFGPPQSWIEKLARNRPGVFDIDMHTNPVDGWAWTDLTAYLDPDPIALADSQRKLSVRVQELRREARTCAYVFGTGPSLEKAMLRNWTDGYRIVCNTIVRDAELWNHIAPDFVVAGDAIYHFGFTSFAGAFRRDLRARLLSSKTLFIYPARFDAIVRQELKDLVDRLVPIPTGLARRVDVDLTRSHRLPGLANALSLLLLPLACTLSRHVRLWGFDGRAPTDTGFWSNSPRHSYAEHAQELREAHPCFFEDSVPAVDPSRYVRRVHGDSLEACLQLAEARGFRFEMLHPSWTPVLQKRYGGGDPGG